MAEGVGLADRRGGERSGGAARRIVSVLASVVRLATATLAAVLVIHIVLTVSAANPENPITIFFRATADLLTLGLADLFVLADPRFTVLVNYGLAALVWLVLGAIVVRLLRSVVRRR